MLIKIDDLKGPKIKQLLTVHLDNAAKYSPADSIFALNLDELRMAEITFLSAWQGSDLLGCGALKEISEHHGEIKSIHTLEKHRGKGVASAILEQLINEAKHRKYHSLSLETGTAPAYVAAYTLYENYGFVKCGAFGDYRERLHSAFMTLVF